MNEDQIKLRELWFELMLQQFSYLEKYAIALRVAADMFPIDVAQAEARGDEFYTWSIMGQDD